MIVCLGLNVFEFNLLGIFFLEFVGVFFKFGIVHWLFLPIFSEHFSFFCLSLWGKGHLLPLLLGVSSSDAVRGTSVQSKGGMSQPVLFSFARWGVWECQVWVTSEQRNFSPPRSGLSRQFFSRPFSFVLWLPLVLFQVFIDVLIREDQEETGLGHFVWSRKLFLFLEFIFNEIWGYYI